MSTYACFERHTELAQRHEENARMSLEDPAATGRPHGAPGAAGLTDGGRSAKAVRWALAQQRLAVREHREAVRLRPRDVQTRQRLAAALKALKCLQEALEAPKPWGLRRFLAHYNLSIRYWDLGKARQAIAEAERACEELRRAGLPLGCAEHNREVMERVQAQHRSEEQRLLAATRRAPEAVGPSYEFGVLLFDKRMLLRAEAQLKWARERARAHSALRLVERDRQQLQVSTDLSPMALAAAMLSPVSMQGRKACERICHLLNELDDDLEFIRQLREKWCVEDESGKAEELQETGIRDGARPHLLPCLQLRFDQDPTSCEACGTWWADICSRGELSEPPPPAPQLVPRRSASGGPSSRARRSR